MRNTTILGSILVLVLALLAACGGDGNDNGVTTAATSQPAISNSQAASSSSQAAASGSSGGGAMAAMTLEQYAAEHAGGPGAIYVGDLNQLVGLAPSKRQGDLDGNVPLWALENHKWIYESDFYKGLLEKANLTNPTPLTSSGESIEIQHACINRSLLPCIQMDQFFAPNLLERTNGQLKLVITSFPELGISGADTLSQVADGTLAMANIYGGYVSGEFPPIEITNLWGLYPDRATEFRATAALTPTLEAMVKGETNGGVLINHNWFSGNDQYFYSSKALRTPDDFNGLKTRSHSSALSDWIEGMGADAQFVAFAEVYTALERGILDAGVTGADAGYGQRWYEVSKYINGPLVSFPSTNNIINAAVWAKIPPDLQQIFIEEGAKSELEALRTASIQNEVGLQENTDAGLEFVEFSPELKALSRAAVLNNVIPGWVRRLGGADKPIVGTFNDIVAPLVGLRINPDGTVTQTN